MRIQHNIAALNSYRNLTGNNNAVGKNLEKLSSGYRINRAGDDAAGLAISEKMRAQITGLETAQKNANDGISLVQTAEGALTEVHSMLNRMVELADQSANGTYDNETDRANLQKELNSLKDEIDRISEGTNFNGINLLDGSLGSSSGASVAVDVKYSNLNNNAGALTLNTATAATAGATLNTAAVMASGTDYTLEVEYLDENGAYQKKSIDFKGATGGTNLASNAATIQSALASALGDGYTASVASTDGTVVISSVNKGASDQFKLIGMAVQNPTTGSAITNGTASNVATKAGVDAYYTLNSAVGVYDGTGDASDSTFEINGQKFAYVKDDVAAAKLSADVNYVKIGAGTTTVTDADSAAMAQMISNKTGVAATVNTTANTNIDLKAGKTSATSGKALTLQIGDTSESFNQLKVSISDMSSTALGIGGIDISSQVGAKASVDVIKSAINKVSSTRGDLGAIQNRLEHTINNLSVTTENMTAAESRIRDVDMASEMMSYTKNNILVQASQAMLAQANQIPQGVLQLLQ